MIAPEEHVKLHKEMGGKGKRKDWRGGKRGCYLDGFGIHPRPRFYLLKNNAIHDKTLSQIYRMDDN